MEEHCNSAGEFIIVQGDEARNCRMSLLRVIVARHCCMSQHGATFEPTMPHCVQCKESADAARSRLVSR